eukprot:scaffold309975_cov47-Prasinocladus_malaysianus.AAC.1
MGNASGFEKDGLTNHCRVSLTLFCRELEDRRAEIRRKRHLSQRERKSSLDTQNNETGIHSQVRSKTISKQQRKGR